MRTRILKPVDDKPVWSIVCFFVARAYRRRGVTQRLVEAAQAYAREHGAQTVEAYPVEPKGGATPDVYALSGRSIDFPLPRLRGSCPPLGDATDHALCSLRDVAESLV